MLSIKDLTVEANGKIILSDFSLEIKAGEIVALMGPNGIGKSTVCKVIVGDPNYKVIKGSITYNGDDLLKQSVNERSKNGIYYVSQNPISIPGVTNAEMLRAALECKTGKHINFFEFNKEITSVCKKINIPESFIHRGINEDMSGGEKKKNELLQLYMLKPNLILLDELDSGLDVDSLRELSLSLKEYLDPSKSILIITHHISILEYLHPNKVHIMENGKIKKTGSYALAKEVEKLGFGSYEVSEKK